ncbi:Teichoic acid translocation permease protein TagG [uncultured bacterium]|nr:Teichoic acid translocation permease protein TagG [uncultured bacterium]
MDESNPERTVVTIIRPSEGWVPFNLLDLWEYRELFAFLVWRDVKVRYKQTILGFAWAILQPFLTMVVFSVFFGRLANLPSDGIPYPIFTFTALLPWQLFAYALTESSNSLVANRQLLTKVYFPRLVIPLSAVLAGLVDFGIAFVVLVIMMLFFGIVPTINVLTLPIFIIFAVVTALAVGLWLSALNVQYRDVRYVIPFLTQFWFFITPIAYSSGLVPEPWRTWYGLNPMVGVVEGFRWALLGKTSGTANLLALSILVIFVLLVSGMAYFRRMEKTFADTI